MMYEKVGPARFISHLDLLRTFNQAGNIGHHKTAPVLHPNHTENRSNRGKRVISNFRTGGRNTGNYSGLPGIGETHQAYIRN
jgi:hypothetical protein